MNFCTLALATLLLVAGSCFGQDTSERAVLHEFMAWNAVQKVLSTARLSGSLEFRSVCDIAKPHAPFLKIGTLSGHEGSALQALQGLFANDPKLQITQESDGKLRMVETDVPRDFLEIKIHHLSFPPNFHSGAFAVYYMVNTPEVTAFMERNIGRSATSAGRSLGSAGACLVRSCSTGRACPAS